MHKRLIQLVKCHNDKQKEVSLGFIGTSYKHYKIGKTYILKFKRGNNKIYTKEFYIAKCVSKFELQYVFDLANDGD